MLERMQRKGNPSALLVGVQTGAATVENSMEFTQNTTAFWPGNSIAGLYHKNPEIPIQKNLCTPMFIAAQFTIAKCWNQPKWPLVNEWIKYCSTFTQWDTTQQKDKKELLPFTTAWMELESIMLSEISQVVKDKYHMISPVSGT